MAVPTISPYNFTGRVQAVAVVGALRFDNGFTLWGRIAGPYGMNFQGLHVDWQIVDEAQEMTEEARGERYQALNGGGSKSS